MASVFAHAALPLLVGRALDLPAGISRRRLAIAAAAVAVVPDLDMATFAFDLHAWDFFGHRGFFHSVVFAAVLALVVTALFFRGPARGGGRPTGARESGPGDSAFMRVLALLFLSAASHGVLDALTKGDVGVALLSPLTNGRFLFPVRPIPVCPLGVTEYFGRWGAIVVGNELVLLLIPVGIATEIIRRVRAQQPFNSLTLATVGWIAVAAVVWLRWPYLYAPTGVRVIKGYGAPMSDDDLRWINPDPLPDQKLVSRFDALQPLFNQKLEPAHIPWSGYFYPAWYGGEAGRWQDNRFILIGRTLFGFDLLKPDEAKATLASDKGLKLAPTEKYDLAHGDYAFSATRHSLHLTHNANPMPRFWFGLCNGVAASAVERPEPFRVVDVQSPDGHVVRFHPLDVKALLAESYYWESTTGVLGGICEVIKFDPGRECSMNPGGLVVGALNYLGLAKRSFLIEVHPTRQAQYYSVASARVDVTRAPYDVSDEPFEAGMKERVRKLVDVEMDFQLSSTVLGVQTGNVPASSDGTRFQKVGLRAVPFHWSATLALDAEQQIIGGRWRGDPADGPDNAAFVGGGPLLDGGTRLELHPFIDWPFVDRLATASASESEGVPLLTSDAGE